MSVIYVFPGQGSQQRGMGKGLFERFPELVGEADAQVGYSLAKLCLDDPEEQLGQTQFTQPALYVVNALTHLARLQDGQPPPDFLAGHSLGEYNALFAAQVFDFRTGLALVRKRGELMAQVQGGAMAAILGLTPERVADLLRNFAFETIDVANYNSDRQTVIAGPAADVKEVVPIFEEAGARAIRLKVSGAFHSRMMRPVAEQFRAFLAAVAFAPPKAPVIANVTAQPYAAESVAELLARQLASPVQWTETVRFLLRQPEPQFEEVGPGKVLTGLIRQIRAQDNPAAGPK